MGKSFDEIRVRLQSTCHLSEIKELQREKKLDQNRHPGKKLHTGMQVVPFTTPDTSNPQHVKPQTNTTKTHQDKDGKLPTTKQIKIPFHISIEKSYLKT